jgi:FAD/FMN-containing dehydrogenase
MKWMGLKEREKEQRVVGWQTLTILDKRFKPALAAAAASLELKIEGTIVKPDDPDYHIRRQLPNWAFQDFPLFIAYCETFADVKNCLQFARDQDLPVVVRSGGHSTAGFSISSGLVIDVSRLVYVIVDVAKKEAIVGAGTRFGHLNTALDLYKLHLPGGGCHDVRVAGFMQGGGYGYTSRMFGMNCDNVLQVTVMLWDGSIVVASNSKNRALFWALRGGTGGNFGVVLQVTYKLYEVDDLTGFRIWWPLATPQDRSRAGQVLDYLQKTHTRREATPVKLGYQAFLGWQEAAAGVGGLTKPLQGWYLLVRGMYHGPSQELDQLLEPLKKLVPPYEQLYQTGSYRQLDMFTHLKPPVPQVDDAAREDKQSVYIDKDLGAAGWCEVITRFLTGQPNNWSLLAIEPYGGAIAEVPEQETAFMHRKVDMDVYVDVFWMDEAKKSEAIGFLDQFMSFMESYGNGQSYQNYPRSSQSDYRRRYWGAGNIFPTLRAIKCKYDPQDFFKFPQGILPGLNDPDPPPSNAVIPQVNAWLQAEPVYEVR